MGHDLLGKSVEPAAIGRMAGLSLKAMELLENQPECRSFIRQLTAAGCDVDVVKFLAYALPRREAVWWGCLFVRLLAGAPLPPGSAPDTALRAASRWVVDPSKPNGRAAGDAGNAAGDETPAGCLALAAYWNGGNIGPPGDPEVASQPMITAGAVAGGLLLALAQAGPPRVPQPLYQAVALALGLAEGRYRWDLPQYAAAHVAVNPGREAARDRPARWRSERDHPL
jgi:hypothetical protein